jgi:hypothetical protein
LPKTLIAAAAIFSVTATPNVKKLGSAITEFRDHSMHTVIAYEYSHRHHDGRWLMIDAGIQTKDNLKYERMHFAITTADERRIPLATQNVSSTTRRQSRICCRTRRSGTPDDAVFRRHPVDGVPAVRAASDGVITTSIVTNKYGPALLRLYFESPDRAWKEGSYTLTIDNGKARAELPIELK